MRKSIPKTLKNKVWDRYIGKEKGVGDCFCCKKEIDSKNFECGHVVAVANGGKNTLGNMRPICGICNKSMGTENMIQFKDTYFSEKSGLLETLIDVNTNTIKNYFFDRFLKLK